MNSASLDQLNDLLVGVPLDDGYAHILIEYDHRTISLSKLLEAIELAGTPILETIELRDEQGGNRPILLKLDTQDVRETVLNLSKYPLIKVTGYNSKMKTNEGRLG